MTDLPAGWSSASLGEVCTIVGGGTPKTGTAEYWGGEIPWITPADMSADRSQVLSGGARTLTAAGLAASAARLVPAGSVVVSSRAPVGYVAIAGAELATNQGCKTAVSPDFIDSRYLYWYLLAARPDLEARASGTTFKEISAKEFGRTLLRWPSLDEQRRIVEILEDHLSRLDAANDYLDAAEGRAWSLVAASARSHIDAASATAASSTVGAHAVLIEYGTSTKTSATANGVPVLRMGNIKHGRVLWDGLKYLPNTHHEFPRLLLEPGDLLFNRTNSAEHVGKCAVFRDGRAASFASYLIRARFDDEVLPEWASLVINSPQGRRYVASVVSQQVGQANVNGSKLRSFPLPVPPVDEQKTRVRDHGVLSAAVETTRTGLLEARRRSEALRHSLLAAAFSGRLTGRSSDLDLAEEMALA